MRHYAHFPSKPIQCENQLRFFPQVQRILQEHTKQGEVVVLVYRGGTTEPETITKG